MTRFDGIDPRSSDTSQERRRSEEWRARNPDTEQSRVAASGSSSDARPLRRPSRRTHRRLLRQLGVGGAPRLLEREDLWTAEFAHLYQAHCDDVLFGDSQEGLQLARFGLMLASRVRGSDLADIDDVRAGAYAVLGSALRATGSPELAEDIYRRALGRARKSAVRADILQRRARLLTETGHQDAALAAVEEALLLFRQSPDDLIPDSRSISTALVMRGWVRMETGSPQEALADFAEALESADPVHEPRTYDSALQNTAYLLVSHGSVDDLGQLLNVVRSLRRRYAKSRHRIVSRYQLLWLEGLLHGRLGLGRRAEKLLLRARDGLAGKNQLRQVLQVSLDLLRLYLEWGDRSRSEELCREMLTLSPPQLGREIAHPEIFAMLALVAEGVDEPERILERIRSLW